MIVRRIQPGMDRLSTQHAPLIVRSGSLPVSFLAVRENWHGRHHWRFLCRTDVCRLRSALESFAARGRHHRVSCAFFLFHHRLASECATCLPGNVLFAAIVISLLAIVSKVVGCGLPLWREGLAERIAGWRGHDAARRSGFDRRAGRAAIADCVAVYLCDCRFHDRGDHDPGAATAAVFCFAAR